MIRTFFIPLLATIVLLSCKKEEDGTYFVSAQKIIGITSNDWSVSEPGLKNRNGYEYRKSPENLSAIIKAEVQLPANDDSIRTVTGSVLLNIAPDNHVFHASFDTEPFS